MIAGGPDGGLGIIDAHVEPHERPVEVPIVCVLTRFGLRSARHLVPTYLDYGRVVREARSARIPGLLRSAFLVEDPRTCYSLSFCTDVNAIGVFGTAVRAHVTAGNRVFGRLIFDPSRGPELWSTKWRLISVSNNLNWKDFNLRQTIAEETCG
jgi:hypothetical protein